MALLMSVFHLHGEKAPQLINSIAFRAEMDHATVKIQDGKLWVEHGGFAAPARMFVMGKSYKPKASAQTTKDDPFVKFEGKLKPFNNATVSITKLRGRGTVEIAEQPSPQNNWTLSVRVVDPPNDGDEYSFKITW